MDRQEWQVETDVLVVGAGGCGLVAALAAHELGAQVLVVEKSPRIGGNTSLSTGSVPGAGTRFQAEAGIEDSPERLAEDIWRQAGGEGDRDLVACLARESAGLVEWLVDDVGVDLRLITDYKHVGHSVPRLHAPPTRRGSDLVRMLEAALLQRQMMVVTGTPVRRLVANEHGEVLGAVVGESGHEAIRARKVILASNGFGGNREMLRKFCPEIADAQYFGHPDNTGEGIRWGVELGAGLAHMGAYQGYAAVAYPHGTLLSWTVPEKGGFLVGRHGRRFVDETLGYSGCTPHVLAQPEGLAYVVFDSRIRDYAMSHELEFRELVGAGGVKEAATVADLAAIYGVDAAALEQTLEAFNRAAGGRATDPLGRRDFGMAPLRPPYCIGQVVGGLFHTQGGLRINLDAQPLREDGSVIPNLYAGGGVAMGISGASGGKGYSSGNGLLSAMGLGRIAGRHAARSILGEE